MRPFVEPTSVIDPSRGADGQRTAFSPGTGDDLPIISLLERYEPISLSRIDAAVLMSRIETKYVLNLSQLRAVLEPLAGSYRVLEIRGVRLNRYRTLYFDTAGRDLYASHQAGRANRFKVRSRSYLDSGTSFLEIKRKTNKGRTVKKRIITETLLTRITPEADRLVNDWVPQGLRALQPALWNEFLRITLVSKDRAERATFDLDVRFRAAVTGSTLSGVVIAEIKQESQDRNSDVMQRMRALSIHPTRFSKYCVGTAMLFPEVKHNRFKPVLRLVHRAMRGERDVW